MGTPKKLPSFFIPEYEESETENIINLSTSAMVDGSVDVLLNNFSELKEIRKSLKKWVDALAEKKKVSRTDYDDFTEMCNQLEIVISKAETRYLATSENTKTPTQIEEKLTIMSTQLEQLSKGLEEMQHRKLTFAESVKVSVPIKDKSEAKNKEIKIKKTAVKEQVIIIKPTVSKGTDKSESEKVRKTIKDSVNKEQSLKIKKAVDVKGGGILLVLNSKDNIEEVLGDKILNNPNLKVSRSKKIKPRIIIYDVPELTEKELTLDIYNRNFKNFINYENFLQGFKPIFKIGPQNKNHIHWVIECSGEMRNAVINKERIYVEWTSCRARDYVNVARCYKCQGLGHISKFCKKDINVCGHCAQTGHVMKDCPNKDNKPICVSCNNNKKYNNKIDANHKTNDKSCPSYIKAIQKLIDNTDYEF